MDLIRELYDRSLGGKGVGVVSPQVFWDLHYAEGEESDENLSSEIANSNDEQTLEEVANG